MAKGQTTACVSNISSDDVCTILGFTVRKYLGTYTYDNGQTRPAVSVSQGKEESAVKGVELIVPTTSTTSKSTPMWECWLVARDIDRQTLINLDLAKRQLTKVFRRSRFVPMESNAVLDTYPQVKMQLSGSEMFALGRLIQHF